MLHYEIIGKGKPVALLHGYLENLKMWRKTADELSGKYQLIMVDLPGHGKSKSYGNIHTMEFMAEKLNEVFEEINLKEAALVGHSMGGYVALAFTEIFPEKVKALLLQNSTTLPDSDEKKEQRLKAVDAAHKNLDTLIKMSIPSLFAEQNLVKMKEEIEATKVLAREASVAGVEAALRGMRERPDRTYLFKEFEGEIGVIIGKYDKAVNPDELKKILPEKENISKTILETGHMSHLEDHPGTLGFTRKFLEKAFG